MQEPFLRADVPYPVQSQQKHATPLPAWIYPYSFYLAAFVYIPIVCGFYVTHLVFHSSLFFFASEDMGVVVGQIAIVGAVLLLLWLILFIVVRIKALNGRWRRNGLLRSEKDIRRPISYFYGIVTVVLVVCVIVLDLLRTHHWYGLSLVVGISLVFLSVLYGPMLLSARAMRHTNDVGTPFADFTKYLPRE